MGWNHQGGIDTIDKRGERGDSLSSAAIASPPEAATPTPSCAKFGTGIWLTQTESHDRSEIGDADMRDLVWDH